MERRVRLDHLLVEALEPYVLGPSTLSVDHGGQGERVGEFQVRARPDRSGTFSKRDVDRARSDAEWRQHRLDAFIDTGPDRPDQDLRVVDGTQQPSGSRDKRRADSF